MKYIIVTLNCTFELKGLSIGNFKIFISGPGIYYGDIDVSGSAGPNSVTSKAKLIPYPFHYKSSCRHCFKY